MPAAPTVWDYTPKSSNTKITTSLFPKPGNKRSKSSYCPKSPKPVPTKYDENYDQETEMRTLGFIGLN
jgi:hypothetical protein